MRSLFRIPSGFSFFISGLFLSLAWLPSAWAPVGQVVPDEGATRWLNEAPVCNICQDSITSEHFICPDRHTTCAECLGGHIQSELSNPHAIHEMQENHLKCFEVTALRPGAADRCEHPVAFEDILALITDTQRGSLHAILNAATVGAVQESRKRSFLETVPEEEADTNKVARTQPPESKSDSESDSEEDPRVSELRKQIEEALILSCPTCGENAQEHDACCAVTCNNRACKSYFCSLCYKKFGADQAGSSVAHRHVREVHLGSGVFEERYDEFDDLDENGDKTRWSYEKRYHWLITRRRLAQIFTREPNHLMDPKLKKKVLHSLKKTFEGDYNLMLWPLPAALPTADWMSTVLANTAMPLQKKIWFLQNEALYLREIKDTENAARVDTAVKELGGRTMAALDLQQAATATNTFVTAATPDDPDPGVVAFRERLKREHPTFFAMGGDAGRIYRITDPENRVPPFILSDLAQDTHGTPLEMTHKEAVGWDDQAGHHPGHCEAHGGVLATKDQLEALVRAMRHGGRYNPNLIAGMQETYFWSSSLYGNAHAYELRGRDGTIGSVLRNEDFHVRCVRLGAW